jgi:hypothetical protein
MVWNKPTCFISYSRKDYVVANELVNILRRAGADVFLDTDNICAGERFSEKIRDEITRRDIFLLLLSTNAEKSKWVISEYELADKLDKSIIPIIIERISIESSPFWRIKEQSVDLTDCVKDQKQNADLRKLFEALNLSYDPTHEDTSMQPESTLRRVLVVLVILFLLFSSVRWVSQLPVVQSAIDIPDVANLQQSSTEQAVLTATPSSEVTVHVELFITQESLNIYVDPTTSDPFSLDQLSFQVTDGNGVAQQYSLTNYRTFMGFLTDITDPTCFRLQQHRTEEPPPTDCASRDVLLLQHALPRSDIFWYDPISRNMRAVEIFLNNGRLDICSSDCTVEITTD